MVVIGLTGASSAQGATQVGQLLPSGASWLGCLGDLNAIQTAVGSGNPYQLPSDGVITRWKFQGITTSPATASLQVWRRVQGNTFELVGSSHPAAFKAGSNSFPTQISAKAGDFLGLHTFGEVDGCAFNRGAGNKPLGAFGPSPSPGDSLDFERTDSALLNVMATLEPDADCDGRGDQSQDHVISGGCPPPSAARLVSRRVRLRHGKATVKVSCPLHGGDCDDNALKLRTAKKLALTPHAKPKKPVVGKAKFTLIAGSTERIRVRLTPKGRKALGRLSPLRTRATIQAKSPTAQPRFTKGALKLLRG